MLKETVRSENTIQSRKIVVMDKQECLFLKIDDIMHAEANGAYTKVYLINGKSIIVCKNLKAFSDKLPDSEFIRVHKSFIINTNYINKYVKSDGGYLVMENGKSIPISVRKKETVINFVAQLLL